MTIVRCLTDWAHRPRLFGLLAGLLMLGDSLAPTLSQGQAPKASAPPAAKVDTKLQLIGSLASSQVYTMFGYIGVVADSSQNNLYPPQRVDELMKEITIISDSLTEQLQALQKSQLTEEDAQAIGEIIEIYALLKQESDALRKYAKEKTEANGTEFGRVRGEAWIRVAKLLDIPVEAPPKK